LITPYAYAILIADVVGARSRSRAKLAELM